MSARKPIEPGCNFSVTCEVPGHVTGQRSGNSVRWSHAKPTPGQRKTRREQWLNGSIDPSTIRDVTPPKES